MMETGFTVRVAWRRAQGSVPGDGQPMWSTLASLDRRARPSEASRVIAKHDMSNGDWIALVRVPLVPVEYRVVTLMPVDGVETASFDNPMYELPRSAVDRGGFYGTYRVIAVSLRFCPGRHRGMVKEATRLIFRHARVKQVDWSSLRTLDGVRFNPSGNVEV